jgi:hypothetical protein
MRKAKVEKDNKKMARELKAHKAKSMEEKSNVVERMRVVFEREREVAVSDATIDHCLERRSEEMQSWRRVFKTHAVEV